MAFIARLLPFVAFCFAGAFIVRMEGRIPRIPDLSGPWLTVAAFALLSVFLLRAWLWHWMLSRSGVTISARAAYATRLKPILAKYIPGKIWVAVGTTALLSRFTQSTKRSFFLVAWFQAVQILSGLMVGAAGVLLLGAAAIGAGTGQSFIVVNILLGVGLLTLFAAPFIQKGLIGILRRKRWLSEEEAVVPPFLPFLLLSGLQWLALGLAYLFFMYGLGFDASWRITLWQPLANTVGIVAPIAPGGLGVREAVMSAFLVAEKLTASDAMLVALLARVWFIGLEVVAFMIGWLLDPSGGLATGRVSEIVDDDSE